MHTTTKPLKLPVLGKGEKAKRWHYSIGIERDPWNILVIALTSLKFISTFYTGILRDFLGNILFLHFSAFRPLQAYEFAQEGIGSILTA